MSTFVASPGATMSWLRQVNWRYPEWWTLAMCTAAWATMIAGADHSHVGLGFDAVRRQMSAWMAMTVATMLPTMIPQMRWTAQGSFWSRRHRAIVGFLVGYLLPWLALGLLASLLLPLLWMHTAAASVTLFVLAAAWQRSPAYRVARRACHRTVPLAPTGLNADRDCLRYGLMVGWACVRSCWLLMLACASTGHGLVAMAGGLLLGLLQDRSARPSPAILTMGPLGLALYYAVRWGITATTAGSPMRM